LKKSTRNARLVACGIALNPQTFETVGIYSIVAYAS
jgi:hypothetical protein